jgi:hypothetical protein
MPAITSSYGNIALLSVLHRGFSLNVVVRGSMAASLVVGERTAIAY